MADQPPTKSGPSGSGTTLPVSSPATPGSNQNSTKPPKSATAPSSTEKAFQALKLRVDQGQQSMQRSIDLIADDARKQRVDSSTQFNNISTTLTDIMASLRAITAGPTGGPTASQTAGSETEPTAGSTSTTATNGGTQADGTSLPQTLIIDNIQQPTRPQATRQLYDLPLFSGAPEGWPKFEATFRQTTQMYGYTDLDNNIRLSKCLSGEAKEAVDCLLIDVNAASTAAVMETLEFRFGRPELLAQAQLRLVREITPIPEAKPELLIPFATKVKNMLAYINKPKTQQYLMNPELLEQLVQKLPLSRRHEWGRHAMKIEPFPTTSHFCTWLEELAKSVSYMMPAAALAAPTQLSNNNRPRTSGTLSTQQPNTKRERMMVARTTTQCDICSKAGHDSANCRRLDRQSVAERWETVRTLKLCFSCLRTGHTTAECEPRSQCGRDGCTRPHHPLLHQANRRINPFSRRPRHDDAVQAAPQGQAALPTRHAAGENGEPGEDNPNRERVHMGQCVISPTTIMFRIVPVQLHSASRALYTYALFDEGSSVTMLDETLADELGLTGPKSTLDLQWFGSRHATETSRTVTLRIGGTGADHKTHHLHGVRTVRQLDLPTQSVDMADLCARYPELRGLPVQNYTRAEPKILLGLDNFGLGLPARHVVCSSSGPVATKTKLGWVLCGPRAPVGKNATVLHQRQTTAAAPGWLNELQQTVHEYFSLEGFGVMRTDRPLESRDDKRAREIMARTTVRVGSRFETGLLWRCDTVRFPESKAMATKRLYSLERKMMQDGVYAAEYIRILDDYVVKGYARRLTVDEADRTDERVWYLPHFASTNPNKPGKLRVVFDAKSVVDGVSLNSMLMKGPDLNRPLVAVLHQFRMGAIGVCADIREMFSQVRIRACDVHSQRFLWRRGDRTAPIDTYVMQSLIFGATSSPCSAQYIKNANADECGQYCPEAIQLIKNGHYVDDLAVSFDDFEEAVRVTQAVIDIHARGGFELRGFISNSTDLLRAIKGDDTNQTAINMQLDADSTEKILGMYWSTDNDVFLFRLDFNRVDPAVVSGRRRPTKRELLSTTMSVYDPFGLLANFTIYAKLLLQETCRHGTGWDEPVPEDVHEKWQQWVAKLECCRQIRVPRCYAPNIATKRVQLHIFADASQSAFASVAYWRVENAPSEWSLAFITGKARCAPPKLISVPRLELLAAVLAARLNNTIRALHNNIAIDRTYFWTDSRTVVQWVRSDHVRFKPFVAHRIAEIHEETAIADWHWVPTMLNAADDATRAKYPVRYDANNRWIQGPDFLRQPETLWPEEPANTPCLEGTEEVKPHSVHLVCSPVETQVLQITRFSNFNRVCRAMAYVLRYTDDVRHISRPTGELLPKEVDRAERHLIRMVQAEAFAEELTALAIGVPIRKSSTIYSLMPHIDQHGILRVTGRINKAIHLPEDARNPVIMPKRHHLTAILIDTCHRRMKHQQQAAVVAEIRLRYWVPHLRSVVRGVKYACMYCRHKSARPIEPVMGQIPADRLTPHVRPFTYTGVDYFGPLHVTVGRHHEKRWVALFTCMTVRAVHLELAADLSTDAFILCLRNFMNLRGVPKRIRSDNGTNFVGASREIRDEIDFLDHDAIQRELSTRRVEWVFNCPSNPEAGGCWERLVQSVKRVLAVTVKEVAPRVETLRSLLLEAANIVNARPLTHLPIHHDDEEPLTPNHFLLGSASSTHTPGPDDHKLLCMRKQWRIAQALKNQFWKRWMLEYLPDLTRRAKNYTEAPKLVVGSLVFVCDPLLPRGQWRRGRVIEIYPGADNRVRLALVKTTNGELKRPVSKLAVLNVEE